MTSPGSGPLTGIDPSTNDEAQRRWMQACRLDDFGRTSQGIQQLLRLGIPVDLLAIIWKQLPAGLLKLRDVDAVFDVFVQYLGSVRSPQAVATLFEREPAALPTLLGAMAIGPWVADHLIHDPEGFELLRITNGQPTMRRSLIDEIRAEVAVARDDAQVSSTLFRFRQREVSRIAFGQLVRDVAAPETYRQLAFLAEAIVESAFQYAYRMTVAKCGTPLRADGLPARCCVIAFDRLGASQQGYDASLRLMLVAETNGRTDAHGIIANTDFFDRLSKDFMSLLAAQVDREEIYRLQFMKPLPLKSDSLVVDLDTAFQHYDLRGRTWERLAFVQTQSIAGNIELGKTFLELLQPWVFRRTLSDADLAGLGAHQRKLQRKILIDSQHRSGAVEERRASEDIEQLILFLQLLHGYDSPEIRVANTFEAIERLTEKHFLRASERNLLDANYVAFRRAEAIRFFERTHALHFTSEERRQIAEAVEVTKRVISSRLEESFPESQQTPVETDLVLDPHPHASWIHSVLASHRFVKPATAYQHLMQLAEENIAVLSTRRCRYFLSIIAPRLLQSIARSTDPDQTLSNLARVANSLGGKGILWELLASSPATMDLIVRLCAYSSYLVNLLAQAPGMVDELMDSLLVDRLPRRDELDITLSELCRGSEDIDRVLQEFKNSMHLRVGVRDILGKESIVDTHRALSDIAEVCIARIVELEYQALVGQCGSPSSASASDTPSGYTVLALGKLGGQEPNYHSDLSFVLLFDKDGTTQPKMGHRATSTSVRHFFDQLSQRVMKRTNRVGPYGRLYELDGRFGPLGKSGVLAMQLDQFIEYFKSGTASAVERQSLLKARPIAGTPEFAKTSMQSIVALVRNLPFTRSDRESILRIRRELQSSAKVQNLKRGEGGTHDIECLVQMLQLAYAHRFPEILTAGTLDAVDRLERFEVLDHSDARAIHQGYYSLREIEAALRLMNTSTRHEFPESPNESNRLAELLGWKTGQSLREHTNAIRAKHREIFECYTSESRLPVYDG